MRPLPAIRRLVFSNLELVIVLIAAGIGLGVRAPLAWLASHQGINVLLAILVFATAATIAPAGLRRLSTTWPKLIAVLAVGATLLPALSWLVSRLVATGSLREGVMVLGLAPCEIASVATTTMAGGTAEFSVAVLIGSTAISVALAGLVLRLEAAHASVHTGGVVVNLLVVVVLPLVAGLALRAVAPGVQRFQRQAEVTAVMAVAALVALIASEVHLSASYLAVTGAFLLFIAGSAGLGGLLGLGSPHSLRSSILLTTSMRDFAIAAGLVAAAFGPAAAAPLGVYGILVLVWGTAVAGSLRRSSARRTA